MELEQFDNIYSLITKITPWKCKITMDDVDISPWLTSYVPHEKYLQRQHGYPKNTRYRFNIEKYKGYGSKNALVSDLKRTCHFQSGFTLSVCQTDTKGISKDKLCVVRMYCFHSWILQSGTKDFEEGKMSQTGTIKQTFKQNKGKKDRPEKYKTHATAPLTTDSKCSFSMVIFLSAKDEYWYLNTFKTDLPTLHCNHRKENAAVLPTPICLLDDKMKEDLSTTCNIHLNPTDASNFMNDKYSSNFSPHQMRQFKYKQQACNKLNKNANSAKRLIQVMEERYVIFIGIHQLFTYFFFYSCNYTILLIVTVITHLSSNLL